MEIPPEPPVASLVLTFNSISVIVPPVADVIDDYEILVDLGGGTTISPYNPGDPITMTTNTITIIGRFRTFGLGAVSWPGSSDLISFELNNPTSFGSITDLSGACYGCTALTTIFGFAEADVSQVTNMSYMFSGATNMYDSSGNFSVNLSNWSTNIATPLMFFSFNGSDTTITDPSSPFYLHKMTLSFVSNVDVTLPISGISGEIYVNWGQGNISYDGSTDISGTVGSNGIVDIYGNFTTFGKGVQTWTGAAYLNDMTSVVLTGVTSLAGAFNGATLFIGSEITTWDVAGVTNMDYMFSGTSALYLELGRFKEDLSNWSTTIATPQMFFSPDGSIDTTIVDPKSPFYLLTMSLRFFPNTEIILPISGIGSGFVVDWGNGYISYDGLTDISGTTDLGRVDVSGNFTKFGNGSLSWTGADRLIDVDRFELTGITDLSGAFNGATSFAGSTIATWDVSGVTSMDYMFSGATELYTDENFKKDLTDWSTTIATPLMFFSPNGTAENDTTTTDIYSPFYIPQSNLTLHFNTSGITVRLPIYGIVGNITIIDDNTAYDTNIISDITLSGTSLSILGHFTTFGNGPLSWPGAADLSGITVYSIESITNFSGAFNGCVQLTGTDVDLWNVSNITDMSYMFAGATQFNNQLLGNWELNTSTVGNVTSMASMFMDASGFVGGNIGDWNIGKVTNFSNMFNRAILFTTNDPSTGVADWLIGTNIPSGANINMSYMFANTPYTDDSGKGIDIWNVSKVTDMSHMFDGATNYANQGLGYWQDLTRVSTTANIKNMSYMFNRSAFTGVGIDTWNVTGVTDMSYMFANNQGSFTNSTLGNWERTTPTASTVQNVKNMSHMFESTGFVDVSGTGVDQWNVTGVTDFSYMFAQSTGFNNTNLGNWNLNQNQPINMARMFIQTALNDVSGTGVDQWDVSQVTDMSYMFANTNFANQGLANWELQNSTVSNVKTFAGIFSSTGSGIAPNCFTGIDSWVIGATDMSSMFESNTYLGRLQLGLWESNTHGTVTSTMSNVKNTSLMFSSCISFEDTSGTGVDIWNLSSVTDMSYMFKSCGSFNNENLGNWQTIGTMGQVRNMSNMFANSGLIDGAINLWDVSGVTDMSEMFKGSINFANPNLNNWDTSSVKNMDSMFMNASGFPGTGIENWDVSNVTEFTTMFNMESTSAMYDSSGFSLIDLTAWDVSGWYVNVLPAPTGFFAYNFEDKTITDPRSPFWDPMNLIPMTLTFATNTTAIALPISGVSGDIHVDYGDGRKRFNLYTGLPTGPVNIWGTFANFSSISTWAGASFLLTITGWENCGITNLSGALRNTTQLTSVPAVLPAGVTNLSNLFNGSRFNGIDIENWSVTNVTDMSYMFANSDISNNNLGYWERQGSTVANVRNMTNMFLGCTSFVGSNIGSWNVSRVSDMSKMFNGAYIFNSELPWDTSGVVTMNGMFTDASGFIGLSGIENWDTSKVTNMAGMFLRASSFNQKLVYSSPKWDTSKVVDFTSMFNGASMYIGEDISGWDVTSAISMANMFANTTRFDSDLSNWSLPAVTELDRMFSNATGIYTAGNFKYDLRGWAGTFTGNPTLSFFFSPNGTNDTTTTDLKSPFYLLILPSNITLYFNPGIRPELPIYDVGVDGIDINWNDGNVIDTYPHLSSGPFTPSGILIADPNATGDAIGLAKVDISGSFAKFGNGNDFWIGGNTLRFVGGSGDGSLRDLSGAFYGATSFTGEGLDAWNVSGVSDMSYMFAYSDISSYSLSSWNTANVKNMSYMFFNATQTSKFVGNGVDQWDTSSVTDMTNMFYGATKFNNSLGSWNTANVKNMRAMFSNASAFTGSGVENWDTHSVTNMLGMFAGLPQFNASLQKNSNIWNTHLVQDMSFMFDGATVFTGIGLEAWDVSGVTDMDYMFQDCSSLILNNLEGWNVSAVTTMSSMFNRSNFQGNLVNWAFSMNGLISTPSNFLTDVSGDITTTSPLSPFGPVPVFPVQTNSTSLVSFSSPPNPSYKLAPGSIIYGTAGTKFYSTTSSDPGGAYTLIMDLSAYGIPIGPMFGNPTYYTTTVFTITETVGSGALFFYDTSSGLSGTMMTFLTTPLPNTAFDSSGNLYMLDISGAVYKVTPSMNNQVSTNPLVPIAQLGAIGQTSIDIWDNILYWVQSAGTLGSIDLVTLPNPTLTMVPGLVQTFLIDSGKVYYYDATSNLSVYNLATQVATTLWIFPAKPNYGTEAYSNLLTAGTEPFGNLFIDRTQQTIYGICKKGGPGFGRGFRGGGVLYQYRINSGIMDVPITSYFKDDGITGSGPVSFTVVPDNGQSYIVTGGSAITPRLRNPFRVNPRVAGPYYQVSQSTLPGYVTSCFNYGTKILTQHHGADAWRPVETLREGDIIKTYKHGYRPITHIGKGVLINDASIWHSSMFQAQMEGFEPLIVTGGHSILVDYLTQEEQEKQAVFWERGEEIIDDKLLMIAPVSPLFTQIKERKLFTYYHFSVQNDGDDDRRYGVWANGFLTETPSVNQYKLHKYHEM